MALVEKEKSIAIKVEEAFGMKDLIERHRQKFTTAQSIWQPTQLDGNVTSWFARI